MIIRDPESIKSELGDWILHEDPRILGLPAQIGQGGRFGKRLFVKTGKGDYDWKEAMLMPTDEESTSFTSTDN